MSLRWQLWSVLGGTVLVALVGAILLANFWAQGELNRYITSEHRSIAMSIAPVLAEHYRQHGSWEKLAGPEGIGPPPSRASGDPPPVPKTPLAQTLRFQLKAVIERNRVIVADPQGQVLADSMGVAAAARGERAVKRVLSPAELQAGAPIEVNGQVVGIVWVGIKASIETASLETVFAERLRMIFWGAGLLAGFVALLLGGWFAGRLIRPLRSMQTVAHKIASGDLEARVETECRDELGQLAASLNSMADQLQTAQRLRRQMIADIAHELRTPIAVIQGNLEAMADGMVPNSPERLKSLHEEALLLTRLVEDLRTLSLAEAGELSLHKEPLSLRSWLETLIESLQPAAQEKQLKLQLRASENLTIEADVQRLRQVMLNLLTNAIEHTAEGGIVTVTAQDREAELFISVQDTGVGIPSDELPHLFNRFYRGKRSRLRKGSTGLGLAIAKALVEAHGGRIWAESAPGQGATFSFILPVHVSENSRFHIE